MPFIPAENTARFELVYSQNGQIVENVFHIAFGGSIDPTMLEDMAAVLKTWWDTEIKAIASTTVSLNVIKARDLTTEAGSAIEYTTGLPILGTNTSQAMPNNSTLAVKWSTGLAGRSFRGRTYHVGMTANQLVDNNHLSSAAQVEFSTRYNNLVSSVETAGANLVVASFYHGVDVDKKPIPRTAAVITNIDNAVINATLDSQRRRLPERGS